MLSLVVIFFARCAEASVCINRDSCHYKNTRLAGVPFQNISTKDIDPGSRSCASNCALTDGCVGVTLDPQEEIRHLYHENNTFEIIEDTVLSLWLLQAPGVPCVQVSWLAPIAYSNTKPFDRSIMIYNLLLWKYGCRKADIIVWWELWFKDITMGFCNSASTVHHLS